MTETNIIQPTASTISTTSPLEGYASRRFLTITELCSFARCPRKYMYACGYGLRPQSSHPALSFGEAIHRALPELFDTLSVDKAIIQFSKHFNDGMYDDDKRTTDTAIKMLHNLLTSIKSQGGGVYEFLKPPVQPFELSDRISPWEFPFAIDIGLPIPLIGRVDGYVRHRYQNTHWALEIKTTSQMSQLFYDGFLINPQVIGYCIALESALGRHIEGTMVHALQVAKTKQENMILPNTVMSHHKQAFLTWARFLGSQILYCEEHNFWPQDISACTSYAQHGSPGYKCDFLPLCQVPDWTLMRGMYRVEYHQPFTELTIGGTKPQEEGKVLIP